ncbi:MAG TPA: hypothetical protein V6D17_02260, partial [Candidatus Obscuribacterales bacterium]
PPPLVLFPEEALAKQRRALREYLVQESGGAAEEGFPGVFGLTPVDCAIARSGRVNRKTLA